eukprot:4028136-Pyramimonas_sp.AAC.1
MGDGLAACRLYNGLLAVTVVLVICYRFVIKNSFLEFVSWLLFLFLEVYPKLYIGSASFYESEWWQQGVTVWEMIAYNTIIDLEKQGPYLLGGCCAVVVLFRIWRWRRRRCKTMQCKRVGSKDMNV